MNTCCSTCWDLHFEWIYWVCWIFSVEVQNANWPGHLPFYDWTVAGPNAASSNHHPYHCQVQAIECGYSAGGLHGTDTIDADLFTWMGKVNKSIVVWVGGNKTPSLLFACLFSIIYLRISFLIVMHPDMHLLILLHLHVTAVIAPPSPLRPVLVGGPSCKASRPIAQRGGSVLSGRIQCYSVHGSRKKFPFFPWFLGCCAASVRKHFMPPGLAATCIAFIAVTWC